MNEKQKQARRADRHALDNSKLRAKLSRVEQDLKKLQKFVVSIMPLDEEWIGDVDGGTIQETAEACGLLQPVEVTGACGDGCNCAAYGDFPQTCYRPTETMKRAITATLEAR